MDDNNKLSSTLGHLGDLTNKAGNIAHQTASQAKKITKQQIGIEIGEEQKEKPKSQELPSAAEQVQMQPQQQIQKEQTVDIVKSFYEKTDPKLQTPAAQTAVKIAEENSDKTPEEIKKMADLKLQLHMEKYYNPTFNPPKKQEEAPAERVERQKAEEEQKRWELQKKEEKKKPVVPGPKKTAETRVGVG